MGKKKGKCILMPPFNINWPKVDTDTEDKVITALTQKLQEFPSLQSKRSKDERRKSGGQPAPLPCPSLSQEEEDQRKARLRRQVVIGHRQVSKCLDWNQLALLLVSGDVQPPILLRSLLPLAASRRCPALCLPSLQSHLTETLGLTTVLAMGVKKPQPGEPSDFADFVSLASALAPPLSLPGAGKRDDADSGGAAPNGENDALTVATATTTTTRQQQTTAAVAVSGKVAGNDDVALALAVAAAENASSSAEGAAVQSTGDGDHHATERESSSLSSSGDGVAGRKEGGGGSSVKPFSPAAAADEWQLMEPDHEKELMEKLLEVVKPYEAVLQTPRSKLTPDQLQTRKNINSCLALDLGALRTAALSGQLDLLLVHSDPRPHPALTPTVRAAMNKGCPVLHVTSLRGQFGAKVRDTNLRAVGFKKTPAGSSSSSRQPEEFRRFVSMAIRYTATPDSDTAASGTPSDYNHPSADGQPDAQSASKENRHRPPACPVYDVSSLYVLKKDSEKKLPPASAAQQKEAGSASEMFISLVSKPSVQYLGVTSLGEGSAVTDAAFIIDAAGTGLSKKELMASAKKPSGRVEGKESSGEAFSGILGLDCVDAAAGGVHLPPPPPPAFHEESRRRKGKGGRKRALEHSAERGEFVSFKVTPTAVKVSRPNPNKKKHKKFKKK